MVVFVGERYGQVLNYAPYHLSNEDDLISGGLIVSGWVDEWKYASLFNRTEYYHWLKYTDEMPKCYGKEVALKFGHEFGHIFLPKGVLEAMEYDKKNGRHYNHIEAFADNFSEEFGLWLKDHKIENLTGHGKNTLTI